MGTDPVSPEDTAQDHPKQDLEAGAAPRQEANTTKNTADAAVKASNEESQSDDRTANELNGCLDSDGNPKEPATLSIPQKQLLHQLALLRQHRGVAACRHAETRGVVS